MVNRSEHRPRIGLALGSGAARGWAHVGVLRALEELGVEVDVYAGCSAGALVAASRLLGIEKDVADWAKSIGPLDALGSFGLQLARGGLVNPGRAFEQFRDDDMDIEDLPKPFAAVATDLATGQEVWLAAGSTLDACRASTAVPMILQAARYRTGDREHWLIDGGVSNPVPVNVARAIGADRVIAVDLNNVTLALSRFVRPTTRAVVPVEELEEEDGPFGQVAFMLENAKRGIGQRLALARARAMAEPQLFETMFATIDIVQAQLAMMRAHVDIADVRLTPDLSCASAAAFDEYDTFEEIGYETTMAAKAHILALTEPLTDEESDIEPPGVVEPPADRK